MPFRPSSIVSKGHLSSARAWLARQYRDPYVKQRLSEQYRSRSAFKLIEINEKYGRFLQHPDVNTVLDLGAAPGGWSQVVAGLFGWTTRAAQMSEDLVRVQLNELEQKHGSGDMEENPELFSFHGKGIIVAVDILPINPMPGVRTLRADVFSPTTKGLIRGLLTSVNNPDGKTDVILSDMAMNITGNVLRDSAASLDICAAVYDFASQHLKTAEAIGRKKGGILLLKHFQHPLLQDFRRQILSPAFEDVIYIKPPASRKESSEAYWLCRGWKGLSSASGL